MKNTIIDEKVITTSNLLALAKTAKCVSDSMAVSEILSELMAP